MTQILRNPDWQFLITLVLTVSVPLLIVLAQHRRKAISYEFPTDMPLVNLKEEFEKKLQVSFNGEPVHDVHLMVLVIRNSGNVPVPAEDYESPVRIVLGKDDRVLTAEIAATDPATIHPELSIEYPDVVLRPLLLNPGDGITVKMLVSRKSHFLSLNARIVGVKRIREHGESGEKLLWITAAVIFTLGLIPIALSFFVTDPILDLASDLTFYIPSALVLIAVYRSKVLRRLLQRETDRVWWWRIKH